MRKGLLAMATDAPVFRLEGVVKEKNETSDFEGPLALILLLLSKNKIEIRDISISLILEQYLDYLARMAELDLDIASEFVAMASHLTYIKTKMLLSGGDEVSELEQLISSLEDLRRGDLYLQIKAVTELLSGMYGKGGVMLAGPPEFLPPDDGYSYVHDSVDLLEAIFSVIGRENAIIGSMNPRQPEYPRRALFSVPEKIAEILERLKQCRDISAEELFFGSGSRTELIATFIAVLELCKVGSVLLTGSPDSVMLTYTGAGREPEAELAGSWGEG